MAFARLLVGDDGSEGSTEALAWAEAFAAAFGASTTALRVPEVSTSGAMGAQSNSVVSPVPALLAAGRDLSADLIVVGRRGSGGFDSLALGSTAHQLAEHADRAVAVVPPNTSCRWPLSAIGVGLDGSAAGENALLWAVSLATPDSEVMVVHALDAAPAFALAGVGDSYEETRARMAEMVDRDWCAPLRLAGIAYSTVVEEGGAAAVLVNAVRSHAADILVVGRKMPSSLPGLAMGSVAHRALGFAPCPTVVVPHLA